MSYKVALGIPGWEYYEATIFIIETSQICLAHRGRGWGWGKLPNPLHTYITKHKYINITSS